MQDSHHGLQLGIFMPNCSNMYAISTYRQEPDEWPYESNKQIALAAEAAVAEDSPIAFSGSRQTFPFHPARVPRPVSGYH